MRLPSLRQFPLSLRLRKLRGHGVVVSELGSSASLEGGAGSIPAGGSFSLFENCQVSVRVQFRKKVIGERTGAMSGTRKIPERFSAVPGFPTKSVSGNLLVARSQSWSFL